MAFELHPNLLKKLFITDLPLCRVLLEDEEHYPWLMLVPRRENVSRLMDLAIADQLLLLQELDLAQRVLWELFQPKQLNVAAIGNKTPQLHVHVIARREDDPAWPHTVWDHPVRAAYLPEHKTQVVHQLTSAFRIRINHRDTEKEEVGGDRTGKRIINRNTGIQDFG